MECYSVIKKKKRMPFAATWMVLEIIILSEGSVSKCELAQLRPTLCDPVDCSLPDSSVHGILQARILEWVAVSFFRGSSQSRNWTQASHIAGRCFYRLSGIKAILDKTASVLSGIEAVVHYHTPALLKSILDEAVKPFKCLFHILYDEMGSK